MGVIQKQSIKGTVYSYVGVLLGFITSGLLFPRILSTEEIGLLRILVSYSMILAQFATLGMNSVTVKQFPYFRDKLKRHHGYLGLTLIIVTVGSVLALMLYLSLHDYIVESAQRKSSLMVTYFYYVIPLFFVTLLFNVLDNYYRVLYNAVKGIVYKEVIQRLLIIFAIVLYYFNVVDFYHLVILYVTAFVIPTLLLIISLLKDGQLFLKPDWKFINKDMMRIMSGVALFGLVSSYSGVLIMNIDTVMIDHYLGLGQTGIYTISFFFGTLILIPSRTMSKISSVVIADAWKENDKKVIAQIYKKTSLALAVAGTYVFIGVWANVDNVFKIVGDDYMAGKYVIFFIGLANLVEMYVGAASYIVVNSPKYRWLTYMLIVYVLLIVLTNIIFIPKYGIAGAAAASFISRMVYALLRIIFLMVKYRFQPFGWKHVLLILIGVVSWYVSSQIPQLNSFIVDIFVRSIVITVIFVPAVYFLKISEDMNMVIDRVMKNIKAG